MNVVALVFVCARGNDDFLSFFRTQHESTTVFCTLFFLVFVSDGTKVHTHSHTMYVIVIGKSE